MDNENKSLERCRQHIVDNLSFATEAEGKLQQSTHLHQGWFYRSLEKKARANKGGLIRRKMSNCSRELEDRNN